MEEAKTPTTGLQPLKQLMKVPRGRKNVDIDPAILPNLDLVTLEQTLHFRICPNPNVKVAITNYVNRLECEMSIATSYTDWPEEGAYQDLFGRAVATAAKQVFSRRPDTRYGGVCVSETGWKTTLRYDVALPLPNQDLEQSLQSDLQAILQELPAVLNLLAQGPQPGRTPVDNQGPAEELEEGDEDEEGH